MDQWDFRLKENSPLRGMGWRGKDIGYYQYGDKEETLPDKNWYIERLTERLWTLN